MSIFSIHLCECFRRLIWLKGCLPVCAYRSVFFMMFFTYSIMAQMFPASNFSTNLEIRNDWPHKAWTNCRQFLLHKQAVLKNLFDVWRLEPLHQLICATYRVRNLNLFNLHACTLEQFIKEHAHFKSKKQLVILNIQDIEWTEHFRNYKVNTQEWTLITSIV